MTDRRFLRDIDRAAQQQDRDLARILADGLGELPDEDKALFTPSSNREADDMRQSLALLKARQARRKQVKRNWYLRDKARRESAGYCGLTGDATG